MKYSDQYMMKDFYNRTFSILDQYDSTKTNLGKDSYEVTLLINCLFGIIIMPRTHWFGELKDKKFGKNISQVTLIKNGKDISLENYKLDWLFRSLRNSLAHWGDRREGHHSGIENIIFEDDHEKISGLKIKDASQSFEIHFKTIDSIREFLNGLKEIINN